MRARLSAMRPASRYALGPFLAACALALLAAAAFWWPAHAAGRGYFPAPLDDAYIHFDFARSLAHGHPFEWVPGNGYSSGETAPLYAVVLALGWLLGFHDRALGIFAAALAVVSVASFVRSVQRLAAPRSRVLAALIAVLVLSCGVLDWTLFSGMEMALFAAALGATLEALARTRGARGGLTREAAQWRLGLWGSVLVLLRPEAGVLVAIFAVSAARGAGASSGFLALLRAALPGALATALVLGINRALTGETQSAGAVLKLLSSNPYLSDDGRARVYVENLVVFLVKGFRGELGALPVVWLVVPLLALGGLGSRARRPLAAASLLGMVAWVLVVGANGNAPHHNFRYYAPAYLLLLVAAALGAATLAEWRRGLALASVATAVAAVMLGSRLPFQSRFFARATENIRDQQIELALRLRERMGPGNSVLVGDAGAIPYVSGRPAIDAMGLGGYRGLPFARAAASGEASIIELLEHLTPEERPAYLALYPNWFPLLTARFGTELDRVTLSDNVICAGAVKVLYRADWSSLETAGARDESIVDELDVADVISEAAHQYRSPAPDGGWSALDILDDERRQRRFDGGRIIPPGQREVFVVPSGTPRGEVDIVVRVDANAHDIRLIKTDASAALALDEPVRGSWRYARGTLTVQAGDVIVLEAGTAPYVDYHVWLRAR